MVESKTYSIFKRHISFGGLTELKDSSILLRNKQIEDGVKIHTCNDYENAIEVIKEANPNKKETTIILKVYFNYPDTKNRRYRSILSQIEEFTERLTFTPSNLILQICCYFPIDTFKKDFFPLFLDRISREYGVNQIYFEYYPVYNYKFDDFKFFFDLYSENISFGFTGYYNFYNRVLDTKNFSTINFLKIPFIPIGILGKNKKRDSQFDVKKFSSKDHIDLNLIFLKYQINKNQNVFGITETTSYSNYLNLKHRFNSLIRINDDNYYKFDSINFNLIKRDQYGGKFDVKDFLLNPRLLLSKAKQFITQNKQDSYFFT